MPVVSLSVRSLMIEASKSLEPEVLSSKCDILVTVGAVIGEFSSGKSDTSGRRKLRRSKSPPPMMMR